MTIPEKEDQTEMFVQAENLGLASDCPEDENSVWGGKRRTSLKAFRLFMRQPRRGLAKAVIEMRSRDRADMDKVESLNRFQVEDVASHTDEEESKMISTDIRNVYDQDSFEKELEEADEEIKTVIARRMNRKTALWLGVAVLGVCLLGMLPVFYALLETNAGSMTLLILMICGVLGIMFVTGLICLFCQRGKLKKAYQHYNDAAEKVVGEVHDSMQSYSVYLTHACNVMRGSSVLEEYEHKDSPTNRTVKLYEKHCADIERVRAELREIFGQYIDPDVKQDLCSDDVFDYVFERTVDYSYPISFADEKEEKIDFLRKGNFTTVPVGVVKSILLRREELYE